MDLVQLNCDCKAKILDYLNLQDQIVLSQTSKYFKDYINAYWQQKYKKLVIDFQESVTFQDCFPILFPCIAKTCSYISIRNLTPEIFDALKKQKFTNVENFRFSQVSFSLDDSHMTLITEIFPNLRGFSPHGNFTGKYIEQLDKLQELDLSYCSKLEFSKTQELLASLKYLKSLVLNVFEPCEWNSSLESYAMALETFNKLEKIKLNSDELNLLQLENANNLKDFTLTDTLNQRNLVKFCYELNKFKATNIYEVECKSDLATPYLDFDFKNFKNLYKIHLVGGNVRIFKDVPKKNLPSLRQILLTNFILEKNVDLNDLLFNCKNVVYVSLQQCNLLEPLILDASNIIGLRESRLELNLYENFICSLDAAPYLQTVEDTLTNMTNRSNYANISKFLVITSKREEVTYERLTLVLDVHDNC